MVESESVNIDARSVIFPQAAGASASELESALERLLTERASILSPTETP
jgi:hypothetical protein